MILLIDGYNVLKQISSSSLVSEKERNNFIKQLGCYAKIRQHKIVIIFDGGPYDRSSKEKVLGVYVIYSGALESADDYIKRYIDDHRSQDLLLISSDRELRNFASRFSIESLPSKKFYEIVQSFLQKKQFDFSKKQTVFIKTTEKEDAELDAIMLEGSKVVPYKVEDFLNEHKRKKSKAHEPSKKERKKMKKIKKL